MDEASEVKNKIQQLTKKDSTSFLQKDLGDIVYERKISKDHFVNTKYGGEMINQLMGTVLVVVNKKSVESFKAKYMTLLLNFYKDDYEKWENRTKTILLQ